MTRALSRWEAIKGHGRCGEPSASTLVIVHRELEQRLHELVATQALVNNLKTFEDGQWVGSQVGATG